MYVCIWPRGAFVLPMFPRNAAGNVHVYTRELGIALFSTCTHYNWRLVSNKMPGILAMMQMTGREQQRSETPEKQQFLHDKAATRKRRREAESK